MLESSPLDVHSEYLCSSELNNEWLMHKHTHTDRSRTGSSLQEEGAGIIHDDTSRSECVYFDSNSPWNGCFVETGIDSVLDGKFFGLWGHFYPCCQHLNWSAASPLDGCSSLNHINNRLLAPNHTSKSNDSFSDVLRQKTFLSLM